MITECEEHPDNRFGHMNCECCSPFHRMRNSPLMMITADEKRKNWKEMADATAEQRKAERLKMQALCRDRKMTTEWVPQEKKQDKRTGGRPFQH
jgi:hypothetical protein